MIAERNTNLLPGFKSIIAILLIFGYQQSVAQTSTDDKLTAEVQYTQVITKRSEKIIAPLNITDSSVYRSVKALVIQQYRNVNATRDSATLATMHTAYIKNLSALLSPQQVEQIKDGMTYGVLPLTYNGYLDMLPALTGEQKKQIMGWLTEAREHAMDAESSEKKHQVFGKYKGRINNYLSAAGYDLKKEGEAWQKRIRERAAANKK